MGIMIDSATLWHEGLQPTITLAAPGSGNGVRLTGLPALLVIIAFFAIVIGFIARFVSVRRSARAALKQLHTAEAEQRSLFAAMEHVVLVIGRDGTFLRAPATNANAR